MPMTGSCFCGDVRFEVDADSAELYQCHCSMCRKVTGSSANAAFLIERSRVRFTAGADRIHSYRKPTGYQVDFCAGCGSTVPNVFRELQYWVPAGLMDGEPDLQMTSHICVASKADWDDIGGEANQHPAVP